MKNLKNKKGFTLVELIVVIAILGILALFLVPSFKGYSEDAKMQVAKSNTRTVWEAAKIAETKAEYDKAITDLDTLLVEVKAKLGDSFNSITTNNIKIKDKTNTTVESVNWTTNGINCSYSGGDNFSCSEVKASN